MTRSRRILTGFCRVFRRAGDEIRTRDIYLGKVSLYQLSYARMSTILACFDERGS